MPMAATGLAGAGWRRSCGHPTSGSPDAPQAPPLPSQLPSDPASSEAAASGPTSRQPPRVGSDPATCTESVAAPCADDTAPDGSPRAPGQDDTAPRGSLPCSGTASKTSWIHSLGVFTMSPNTCSLSLRSIQYGGGYGRGQAAETISEVSDL